MVDFQNILSVDAHPTLPGASLVKFRDGSSMAAPASVADKFKPSVFGAGATADSGFYQPQMSPIATDAAPSPPAPMGPPAPPVSAPVPVATPQSVAVPQLSRGQAPSTYDSDLGLPQYEIDRINRPKYVAGRAAYDPGADDASRQAVRERKTEQRQGVGYWDEESRINDVINAREAQSAELEAKSMAMQANREAQAMAYADQQKALADETARRQAEEQSWQAENDRLNQEAKAIATREIDPGRAFRDASPFQTIALTIAAGMRGFATSGRDTAVMDSVQRMIDRDVAAQENDIARAKGNADNALARNVQRYGSIEAGKAALKLQQTQVAAAKFDATVAALGENADKAKLEAERQKFDAAIYSRYNELKAAAMGTTSEAIDSSMRAPQAAVAGGFVAPSDAEIDKRTASAIARQSAGAELGNKRLTNESKALENEFTRAKGVTPEQDAKRQDTITTAVKDYGTRRAASEAARAQMERFVAENKLETDEKGDIKTPDDIAGFGWAVQHSPGSTVTHQGVVNRSTLNELVANVAISRFGAYTPEQGKTIREEIIGDGRPETLAVNINNMRRKLIEENKNLNASFSPEVRAQYDKNKTSFTKSTDSKAKLFKPVSP